MTRSTPTRIRTTPGRLRIAGLRAFVVLALAVLGGCASLLPGGRSEEPSPFASFEAARDALDRVEPYRATVRDLKDAGFDTAKSANVREVPYPQLLAQLLQSANLEPTELDDGIRDCIALRQRCRAYQFRFSRLVRTRTGNFFLDFLNFDRTTQTSGWRFEGVVLVRDDGLVLFRNHAGEPRIEQTERTRNPLGPFQSVPFDTIFR